MALSADGNRLYVADMALDAVARDRYEEADANGRAKAGMVEPDGFTVFRRNGIRMSMAMVGMASYTWRRRRERGRGQTTLRKGRPRGFPSREGEGLYWSSATLLYGSLAAVDVNGLDLKAETAKVADVVNRMKAMRRSRGFSLRGAATGSTHVIYIIKENRTYDQVFGDLAQGGRPVGNGDARLAMYGASVTPNEHALALQFGVLDNFFDSGEVSGDGQQYVVERGDWDGLPGEGVAGGLPEQSASL